MDERTSGSGSQARPIGGDVAAVYFKVLLFAWNESQCQQDESRMRSAQQRAWAEVDPPGCVNHCGLMRCMVASRLRTARACSYATMKR